MALHFLRRAPAANVVGAGNTSTFQLPIGPTYRSFELRYKSKAAAPDPAAVNAPEARMATEITGIRVKIDGLIRWEASGADWIAVLKRYGYTIDDGVLPLIFARTYARLIANEDALSWGTANVDTLTLEVDIDGAAIEPALSLDTWYDPVRNPLGGIIEVHTVTFEAGLIGVNEISTLPKKNGDLVAMHLFNGDISKLEIRFDDLAYVDGDLETLESNYRRTGRVPDPATARVFEPTWLDRFDDRIPLANVQDFRVKASLTAGGSIRFLMETYNTPLGLPADAQAAA